MADDQNKSIKINELDRQPKQMNIYILLTQNYNGTFEHGHILVFSI